MAVIALCSASGSPGVTTTTIALAMSWPRPVLIVEADPAGSNGLLAGIFRGTLEYETGILDVATSPLAMTDALRDAVRPIDGTEVRYVVGTQTHTQAAGLREVWDPLAVELADLERTGQDVLVDAGRLGPASPEPLLATADLTLLVTRTHLPALAGARSWAQHVTATSAWRQPGMLLVGDAQPYTATEVRKALGIPVVASIADDAPAAQVYHRGSPPPRRFETGPYIRSVHAAVAAITATVTRARADLVGEVAR